jgi:hypothetical protein
MSTTLVLSGVPESATKEAICEVLSLRDSDLGSCEIKSGQCVLTFSNELICD